jgi:hypothetical protein
MKNGPLGSGNQGAKIGNEASIYSHFLNLSPGHFLNLSPGHFLNLSPGHFLNLSFIHFIFFGRVGFAVGPLRAP